MRQQVKGADQPVVSPALCTANAVHRIGDKTADALCGLSEMAVDHVCIAGRGAVAAVSEQLADRRSFSPDMTA